MSWSLVLSVVFIAVEILGRVATGDPRALRAEVILGVFILAEIAAWLALRRSRVGLSAAIFAWALLGLSVASTTLTTFITPPLMLIPLFAMAVGLPFLQGQALRALMLGACVTELLVTISSARFLPVVGPLPPTIERFLFVAATTSIALLIAFLLHQFTLRLRGALEVARAAVATREEFLSIASHELQTPLTVLKLHLQRLPQLLRTDPMATEAKVRAAETQVTKLSRLVGNMLDLSRLEAGKLSLELVMTRLDTLVQRVVGELLPMADRTGSTIQVTVANCAVGNWDATRVEQVISNLLSNAIKYGEGKPIQVTVDQEGAFAQVKVQDQGAGIAPGDLGRLFVQFERGTHAHARAQSGVGLGLYIAKQLSETMGGALAVSSQPNQGATFTLRLPLRAGVEAEAPATGA
jgi:signal transduction histidine kinase